MIQTLDEVMSGARVNLHGDIDIQMAMHVDGTARLLVFQGVHEPVAMDAYHIAHLARVLRAMVQHGGMLNQDPVADPRNGGVH